VLLNSCSGGVAAAQTASLAEALLRGGIPAVVAMQAPVSDAYAVGLAKSFYTHLARRENFLASRALADARKEQERQRLDASGRGAPAAQTQPEFATAALYVAGEERPIADFALDKKPLRSPPVRDVPGAVPQLRLDDLIGRRRELREALRSLRDPARTHAGVVLTGIGGVGKSALAGRVMCRLAEDGWLVPSHRGRFSLTQIAVTIASALAEQPGDRARKRGALLAATDLDDRVRLDLVGKVLTEERVLLVLDDFEDNLTPGGGAFLDPDVAEQFQLLTERARNGRLLMTCRYPLPDKEAALRRVAIGPLSAAQTRKLLLRLPGLSGHESAALATVLRMVGGHPRVLEFLDALLRGGEGRVAGLNAKLRKLAADMQLDLAAPRAELEPALAEAVALGARDVFLEDLLALAGQEGIAEFMLQAAVSNLPMTPQGLARMMADGGTADTSAVGSAAAKLESLSLLHRFPNGALLVHRWTAQGLAGLSDPASQYARSIRAGKYRMWRNQHETHAFEDAVEAIRNFLAGQDFDAAVDLATAAFDALRRMQQSLAIAALATEVLETLPQSHRGYAGVGDEEAQAHLALGQTTRAVARYQKILDLQENLSRAEPDRTDY
jgi:AAA ATPase-like protein/CHAT domain-containing protein